MNPPKHQIINGANFMEPALYQVAAESNVCDAECQHQGLLSGQAGLGWVWGRGRASGYKTSLYEAAVWVSPLLLHVRFPCQLHDTACEFTVSLVSDPPRSTEFETQP